MRMKNGGNPLNPMKKLSSESRSTLRMEIKETLDAGKKDSYCEAGINISIQVKQRLTVVRIRKLK